MAASPSSERFARGLRIRRARALAAAGLLAFWTILVAVAWGGGAALALLALVAAALAAKVGHEHDAHEAIRRRASELIADVRGKVAALGVEALDRRRWATSRATLTTRAARTGRVAGARARQGIANSVPVLARAARTARERARTSHRVDPATALAVAAAAALLVGAAVARETSLRHERGSQRRALSNATRDLRRMKSRVASLEAKDETLWRRVRVLARRTGATAVARVTPSVVTVQTPSGAFSGWVAWHTRGGASVITASAAVSGREAVDLRTAKGQARAALVRADPSTGLAVVEVDREIAPALWQRSDEPGRVTPGQRGFVVPSPHAAPGDVLNVITSTAGSAGAQTYVAAVDGVEGAPVVDPAGAVVGTVVESSSGDLVVVPVSRLCGRLRNC